MKYDYDLIVLGGGAAGLVCATAGAALGARTALIEKNKLGGDCTWYGCIPSKALLKSAQVFSLVKRIKDFGISIGKAGEYDPRGVLAHIREIIEQISLHHAAEVLEKRGIKVLFAEPRFVDSRTIKLTPAGRSLPAHQQNSKNISAKRFIICTGSHPLVPPIAGLKDISYLTNENIFTLQSWPKSLAVLGGGPLGVEISQAFSRLGVEVSIIEMLERILFREDRELAHILTEVLVEEGIQIYTGRKAVKFAQEGDSVVITVENKDKQREVLKAEKVLVAVGRVANVSGLALEKAGVKYTQKGIAVDSHLRTSAGNIYACGDVVGPYQFSHMAEYQAIIAVGNALFPFKRKVDYRAVPWCTFTEPELAHLGLTEEEAQAQYGEIKVYRSRYGENDRAVTGREERGLAKVICNKRGRILGAHIVGAQAGEIIHEYVLAKSAGLNIRKISSAIHIYPTVAQTVKKTADQYYIELLSSPFLRKIASFFIRMIK